VQRIEAARGPGAAPRAESAAGTASPARQADPATANGAPASRDADAWPRELPQSKFPGWRSRLMRRRSAAASRPARTQGWFAAGREGRPAPLAADALLLALLLAALLPIRPLHAQQLEPRAYAPSPVGVNVVIVGDAVSTGDLSFDPSIPVTNGHADLNIAAGGYLRTLDLFGRSANIGFLVPYVHGDVSGLLLGQYASAHRSAFGDPSVRLAVNLYGAPAMTPKEFAAYHEGTIVGASLVVVAPLGAYDSSKLVNVGANRWAFKPELGLSRAVGPWTFEGDVAAWLFTDNGDFYGGRTRSQDPISALQLHVIYTFRPRLWLAVDSTYYNGGRTTINGKRNFDLQQNSRAGITLALPIGRQQALKVAYSKGARTRIGGDFDTVGVSYSYAWADRR
jgi:Putative MetA-pathway of phenol degradation